jgi:hypothetical protein
MNCVQLRQSDQPIPFKERYQAAGTIMASAACSEATLFVSLDGGGAATHVDRYPTANSPGELN